MTAPRRILFLHSSAGRYGADRQLLLLASGLRERGLFEPLVVLASPGPLGEDLRGAGVEVVERPLAVVRRSVVTPRGLAALGTRAAADAPSLAAFARRRGVILVHSNTSVILSGFGAARVAGVPHVCHVREIYAGAGGLARIWPVYRRLLASADALACVSAATAAQFAGGPGAGRARVLYDGLTRAPERAERAAARAALGLAPDVPTIAMLGRISAWKGQELLVRALAEPALADVGAVGLIAGDAWPGAEDREAPVRELTARLGLGERVRFLGFRDDVGTVLGAADVVAVPSTAPDPLPGSAVEAAAAGCAVVAADHGGLPEIIADRRTGRLFAPGDPAALAAVARELIDDPEQAARLGATAAVDTAARFDPARLDAAIDLLYGALVGEDRGRWPRSP